MPEIIKVPKEVYDALVKENIELKQQLSKTSEKSKISKVSLRKTIEIEEVKTMLNDLETDVSTISKGKDILGYETHSKIISWEWVVGKIIELKQQLTKKEG